MPWLAIAVILLLGCDAVDLDELDQPVIGGRVVGAGEFPNVVALIDDAGKPLCTGTLIRDDAVLTAAHCVDPSSGDPDPEITFDNDARAIAGPQLVAVASAEAHPSFAIGRPVPPGVSEFFDIAVLILAEPVTGIVPAVMIDPVDAEANLIQGTQVDLVGYGLRVDDPGSPDTGEKAHGVASIAMVGDNEVQVSIPGEQQSCNGDSGGPVFVDIAGGTRLIGVVSRSADNELACDSGTINTRVDAYRDFIDAALGDGGGGDGSDGGGMGGGGMGGGGSGTGGGGVGPPREGGGCSVADRGPAPLVLLIVVALALVRPIRRPCILKRGGPPVR